MTVEVLLFAAARELAGSGHIHLELPEGAVVGDLRRSLQDQYPSLASILPSVVFSMDNAYVNDMAVIRPGAVVACIPPVSGGL